VSSAGGSGAWNGTELEVVSTCGSFSFVVMCSPGPIS
jgi:hypothetical protein